MAAPANFSVGTFAPSVAAGATYWRMTTANYIPVWLRRLTISTASAASGAGATTIVLAREASPVQAALATFSASPLRLNQPLPTTLFATSFAFSPVVDTSKVYRRVTLPTVAGGVVEWEFEPDEFRVSGTGTGLIINNVGSVAGQDLNINVDYYGT